MIYMMITIIRSKSMIMMIMIIRSISMMAMIMIGDDDTDDVG